MRQNLIHVPQHQALGRCEVFVLTRARSADSRAEVLRSMGFGPLPAPAEPISLTHLRAQLTNQLPPVEIAASLLEVEDFTHVADGQQHGAPAAEQLRRAAGVSLQHRPKNGGPGGQPSADVGAPGWFAQTRQSQGHARHAHLTTVYCHNTYNH